MFRNRYLFALAAWLLLGVWQAPGPIVQAQDTVAPEGSEQSIIELLAKFRLAAKNADAKQYFDCLHEEGIFFGTDGKERFTHQQLRSFLGPYFEQGAGWTHEIKQRHVYVGPNDQIGWFEEHSQRPNVGPMRTTGVVTKTDDGWKIVQYHVSILIPNEAVEEVVSVIQKSHTPKESPDK